MPEQVIIAITIIAIALIAGVTLNAIVEKVMQGRRLRHDVIPAAKPQALEIHQLAERQQMIEDRLRVLERIATDRGSLLADEIEALRRDLPAPAPALATAQDKEAAQ
ncbi:MAG: hypothetical protein ACK4IC_11555 [Erythrobacter sp.]